MPFLLKPSQRVLSISSTRSRVKNLVRRSISSSTVISNTALVLGSSGCLGRAVSQHLSNNLNLQVIGADVTELPNETDSILNGFITIPKMRGSEPLAEMTTSLVQGASEILDEGEEIDVIVCASGGWQGDQEPPSRDSSEAELLAGAKSYGDTIDRMISMNLHPVLAAGFLAHRFMANEGLFVVIGATAALSSTPGMLGYGLSKVGAHHFIHTLGDTTGKSVANPSTRKKTKALRRDSEYLDTLSVVGILPTTIDTPSNRDAMPDADFDKWTKPNHIAKEIGTWITTPSLRPHSGSLIKVVGGTSGAVFQVAR